MRVALAALIAPLGPPSCNACGSSPSSSPSLRATATPPAQVFSAPASASAPLGNLSSTSQLEIIAAGENVETCNADVDRHVEVASLP
jgi:hypothetical protein